MTKRRQHQAAALLLAGLLCPALAQGQGKETGAPKAAEAPKAAPAQKTVPAQKAAPVVKKGKDGKDLPPDAADALVPALRGPEAQAIEAAQKLGALPGPRAMDVMLDELAIGAPPRVAGAMLEALIPRKDPRGVEVLSLYAQNRNPDLRRHAVQALGDIPDARDIPLRITALSDGTSDGPAATAQAMGKRRE